MNKLVEKVLNTIDKYKLISNGDKILVGVSGGPDSIFLLYVLNELKSNYSIELKVAHLNHLIREEAFDEELFVERTAKSLNLPYSIKRIDAKLYAKTHRLSLEEGARELRYEFLNSVAEEFKMNKIALGHTLDDQIETLIFRIIRGTGGRGFLLIPPIRDNIIRPIIEIRKEDIINFLQKKNIEYKIDKSNYDMRYKRNFIRHNIIQKLLEIAPQLHKNIINIREIFLEEEHLLEKITKETMQSIIISQDAKEYIFDLKKFISMDTAIKRRILRNIYTKFYKKLPSLAELNNCIKFIEGKPKDTYFNFNNIKIVKSGNKLLFTSSQSTDAQLKIIPKIPGVIELNGMKIKFNIISRQQVNNFDDASQIYIDIDKINFPIYIRSAVVGDKFIGFGGTKKLSDIFIDEKIPKWERNKIPLLVDNKGILWIIPTKHFRGKRANRALLNDNAQKILEVSVKK